MVEQLAKSAIEPAPSSPEELARRLKAERDQFTKVIKDANIKLD